MSTQTGSRWRVRKWALGGFYRYGFNGKENDNEVKGEGNQQDYGMRIYDPRIGKFLSGDPLFTTYPALTPYQFASNSPILNIDLDGAEALASMADQIRTMEEANIAIYGAERAKNVNQSMRTGVSLGSIYGLKFGFYTLLMTEAPQVAIPWMLSDLTKAPVLPSPQALAGSTVTTGKLPKMNMGTRGAAVVDEIGTAASGTREVGNGVAVSPPTTKASNVSRVYESRINIAKGRTRFTPLRPSSGEQVSAGWDIHVLPGHFNRLPTANRSVFTIEAEEVKSILQSKAVVSSPVTSLEGGQYVRTVDVGKNIGTTSLKQGETPTSWMKVFTDKSGNLITAYPVAAPTAKP